MIQHLADFVDGFGEFGKITHPMIFAISFILYRHIQPEGMAVQTAIGVAFIALMEMMSGVKGYAFGQKAAGHGIPSILCVCKLNRHCGWARQ